jgi:hypothetical protein
MGSIETLITLEVPSSSRILPGSFPLKTATLPSSPKPKSIDAPAIATSFIQTFNKALANPQSVALPDVFLHESYWRDHLCLSWDLRSFNGLHKIIEPFMSALTSEKGCRIKSVALDRSNRLRAPTLTAFDVEGKVWVVQAFLTVETDVGKGAGVVRLAQEYGVWKVFTLFTYLRELNVSKGLGVKESPNLRQKASWFRKSWLSNQKIDKVLPSSDEPVVLIVGMCTIFCTRRNY